MIYRNEVIPQNYNKIAEISDNYIVWVRESRLENDKTYNAYIQLLSPSFSYYFTDSYTTTKYDNETIIPHYNNNGMYSYVDYYEVERTLTTQELFSGDNGFTSNEYNRSDLPFIFICQVIICVIFVWVLSNISRLFFKGGLR